MKQIKPIFQRRQFDSNFLILTEEAIGSVLYKNPSQKFQRMQRKTHLCRSLVEYLLATGSVLILRKIFDNYMKREKLKCNEFKLSLKSFTTYFSHSLWECVCRNNVVQKTLRTFLFFYQSVSSGVRILENII